MNRLLRMAGWFAVFSVAANAGTALSHEPPVPAPAQGEPALRSPHADGYAGGHATIDPVMRALVIGIAASILREAAAQPDPVEALGDAVERRLAAALANPNTMRLAESALHQALQDAPPELREPLAAFALSLLRNMRRDLLAQPRRSY